jgi:copper/silver efflux system protein
MSTELERSEGRAGPARPGLIERMAGFVLKQKLVVVVLLALVVGWGVLVAPFGWDLGVERDTIPVDAIPDLGENQQIVFTEWPGRSPQDVDDQITYPLTVALLGLPEVRTIRSFSMLGFSSIYVVFREGAEFYWARSRILEKLASLPPNTLPDDVTPALGPDATPLGQVIWYTLEGRDPEGRPTGGWDLHELRSIQDFIVRYALASAEGVSEVSSIGGFVREYQIDVDPNAMRYYGVTLGEISDAVEASNAEVGAGVTEITGVEYLIRGVGFVRRLEDIEAAVVTTRDHAPVRVRDVARVALGPAWRGGALDRGGVEAVGGIVVARYGANPLVVIQNVRAAMQEVQPSLPSRTLADGTVSQVTIVPVYDRGELIQATLGTLSSALYQQILITVLVVLILMVHLRSSILISMLLPVAVGITFVAMKLTGVDANVVALAGIAIAIGTMVDIGIIITENIVKRLQEEPDRPSRVVVREATGEVGSAVLTAVATTIISFLPVFFLTGSEGKLFGPLAFTKTYAIAASVVVALIIIPPLAWALLGVRMRPGFMRTGLSAVLALAGIVVAATVSVLGGVLLSVWGLARLVDDGLRRRRGAGAKSARVERIFALLVNFLAAAIVMVLLTEAWLPLGARAGDVANLGFVIVCVAGLLGFFWLFQLAYPHLLRWVLNHKLVFMLLPLTIFVFGLVVWQGFGKVFGWLPAAVHRSELGHVMHEAFPGLKDEFMPQLDEGAFLYMPSTMPHGSIGETLAMVSELDRRIESVPEVEYTIGKLGRAESALDPAPIGMIETLIVYSPEYVVDADGRILRFRVGEDGEHVRDEQGALIPDEEGLPFRNWRDEIRRPQDIWDAIVQVARIPGLTEASMLQPISTRLVMLQSGIRAPFAVRLQGPDLESLAQASLAMEAFLREHPMVNTGTVTADRPVGKPYLEIRPRREALARYGIAMGAFQEAVDVAIGGRTLAQSVEGRERYPIRVRYPRELRDTPDALEEILLAGEGGMLIPLGEVADVVYVQGPQEIRSQDTALISYVMFNRLEEFGDLEVVASLEEAIREALRAGTLELPPLVRYGFTGTYENAERASRRLALLLPVVMVLIFLLLYLQFRSALTTFILFTGIAVALSGGFVLIWMYGQPWFLDMELFGANLRDVFQVFPFKLSVAVWVGFIALFGIATDDGVVMATYLKQQFARGGVESIAEVRERVLLAGQRRIRACLMTTATTLLALLPILTSYGTGADVMIPMAVPVMGGMAVELITLFVVPMLYSVVEETRLRASLARRRLGAGEALPTVAAVAAVDADGERR